MKAVAYMVLRLFYNLTKKKLLFLTVPKTLL